MTTFRPLAPVPSMGPESDPHHEENGQAARSQIIGGGAFILDQPPGVPAVWGEGEAVLWPRGEPFMLCGPAGVGKTTLLQQLALSLVGIGSPELLGLPVQPYDGKVLYLAMDRPAQAARSFRRMVSESDRDVLDARLIVHKGPLIIDLVKEPGFLRDYAKDQGTGVVMLDSLKDLAPELDRDKPAGMVNRAMQACVADDIDVSALHHQRKSQAGAAKPTQLADVYGSTWLTAGMGSVALIWGEPGDPVVELSHLKQPAADVGPLQISHDHFRGVSTVTRGFDLLSFMRLRGAGVTAHDVAVARFDRTDPTKSMVEKARRELDGAVRKGLATVVQGTRGGVHDSPTTWFLTPTHPDPNEEF